MLSKDGDKLSKDGVVNLNELKKKKPAELAKYAAALKIEAAAGSRKHYLLSAPLQARTENSGAVYPEGVLDTLPDGFGFLRAPDHNYLPGPDDIHVAPSLIRRLN